MSDHTRERAAPGASWSDVALGCGVIFAAGVLAWQTLLIPSSPLYARVGPTFFPWITVTMLAGLGILLAVQGLRGGWPHDEDAGSFDWRGFLWFSAGALLNIALIEKLGFILSSTILFVCTARAFESDRLVRDVLIGFVLALIAYVGFDQLLGYKIGTGLVEGYIQMAADALQKRP